MSQPTDKLEKAKNLSVVFSTAVLPLIVLFVGNNYTAAIKSREIEGKFVELSVGILQQRPSEPTADLREWATKVLDKYSGIEFSPGAREKLINETQLPTSEGLSTIDSKKMLLNLLSSLSPLEESEFSEALNDPDVTLANLGFSEQLIELDLRVTINKTILQWVGKPLLAPGQISKKTTLRELRQAVEPNSTRCWRTWDGRIACSQ